MKDRRFRELEIALAICRIHYGIDPSTWHKVEIVNLQNLLATIMSARP